ncbi:cell wall-binding repeat-containing protein [Alkalicoccus chagannorensis]|uniref:cell wall-binding repeat-containing protein n=1 Tax=Alkalicoccus chagannorensis TaxID=427072 RepID=UPI000413D918|nr:cell wall-binding repeat-containing protein [Alkalicoccus chagannorensis]
MKKTWMLSGAVLLTLAACTNENNNDTVEIQDQSDNNNMAEENNEMNEEEDVENLEENNEDEDDQNGMDHDGNDNAGAGGNNDREAFEEEHAALPEEEREEASENLLTRNTKNITRIDQDNLTDVSIETSQTIWPATHEHNQPGTVILADPNEWQQALSVLTLVHHPNDGPLLLAEDGLNDDLVAEIERLAPLGNDDGVEVLSAMELTDEEEDMLADFEVDTLIEEEPAAFAAEADSLFADTIGSYPEAVLIGSSNDDHRLHSSVAGSWISHMDEPLLYVDDEVPDATIDALEARDGDVEMYVLGGENIISEEVEETLSSYGNVERIDEEDPVELSIAFASYEHDGFGWDINDPGHGFVFASTENPDLVLAGAPFAHLGKHAPLLWMEDGEAEQAHADYLAQIKPSFEEAPMEGPYNHSYLLGTEENISFQTQGVLDQLMEIQSVTGDDHGDHGEDHDDHGGDNHEEEDNQMNHDNDENHDMDHDNTMNNHNNNDMPHNDNDNMPHNNNDMPHNDNDDMPHNNNDMPHDDNDDMPHNNNNMPHDDNDDMPHSNNNNNGSS